MGPTHKHRRRPEGTRVNRFNSSVFTKANLFGLSDEVTITFDGTAFFGADTDDNRIEVASPDLYVQQQQDFVGTDLQLGTIWKADDRLNFVVGAGLIVDAETLGQTSLVLKQGDTTPRTTDEGTEQTFMNPGLFGQANWEAIRAVPDPDRRYPLRLPQHLRQPGQRPVRGMVSNPDQWGVREGAVRLRLQGALARCCCTAARPRPATSSATPTSNHSTCTPSKGR